MGKREHEITPSKVYSRSVLKNSKTTLELHMDRNIRRMPQENDIIVKELLDVQAATIGVKKLDDKMEKNATEKEKKENCPRKLHSTLSYAEQRMCTLTCSRGATAATDKSNLIRITPNVYII